jgi:hypothetical protein
MTSESRAIHTIDRYQLLVEQTTDNNQTSQCIRLRSAYAIVNAEGKETVPQAALLASVCVGGKGRIVSSLHHAEAAPVLTHLLRCMERQGQLSTCARPLVTAVHQWKAAEEGPGKHSSR